MATLEESTVRQVLLDDYAVAPMPVHVGPGDPLPHELLAQMQAREQQGLRRRFAEVWADLSARWRRLASDQRLSSFKTWRDKLIAHAELHHAGGKYHLTDLSTLGLKWGDLGDLVGELQEVVERVNLVTRGASFAWTMLDEQLTEASHGFWSLLGSQSGDE